MYEPMDVKIGDDRTSLDLFFPPNRDGKGDTFTVRFINADGRMFYSQFTGGSCDVAKRSPAPDPSRIEARPGDDIQALADRYGTVVLSRGTYRLSHTLILKRPVTLTSDGGATIVFAQDKTDPPWTAAIKVRCGNTTLNGFAIRFEGTFRWNTEVSYGPAIIGMTDNFDPGYDDLKFNVVFTKLDVENPAVNNPGTWSEAVRLLRLCHARSGVIAGNVLRGGPIEFFDGPWQIVNNTFRGTVPGTFSHGFLTGHGVHDVLVRGNRLSSPQPSGKTWHFLVFTSCGTGPRRAEYGGRDRGTRRRYDLLDERAGAHPHRGIFPQVRGENRHPLARRQGLADHRGAVRYPEGRRRHLDPLRAGRRALAAHLAGPHAHDGPGG